MPRGKDGIVYAKSEEECERKLWEMIKELKNEAVIQYAAVELFDILW